MPYDITLCPGKNCPIQKNCYRFTAEIIGRQDFFVEPPYSFVNNCCEYFISNLPDESAIRVKAYEIWQKKGCPGDKAWENWLEAEKELKTYTPSP
ncbi:hypothetical protein BCD64_25505 [Nostoc sp. MBR 210]|uniref:DUF2934 domain-containing protein n=1 Tax=Nostoc spongiaeforme FACHB-130 TaxID=1357510 RepID=A0ABR8FNW0_9NOSO|nr:DUF2934 domain-containing protein [Nostoc spongiaeforme]MBD2593160.1 DUF2934 domain-containing protein [Nostoc spongiaeforme FACHB-130]OCQ91361.1 hypothetical protein BCD64_25505 [Nostoc sp. MBR 210]